MAALFGIRPALLPATWAELESYMEAMVASGKLGADALSRDLAQHVLHGRGSWVPVPRWYRALTIAWLPERLRTEFALEFGAREQRRAALAAEWLPHIYRLLPAPLRFVGPYQEALARLAGRRSGRITELSNRFWMGQPYMMFAGSPTTGKRE